jgi:DNA-binding FrmR family transcriptional regulator/copper chaperone CopZ
MDELTQKAITQRLASAAGHIKGIERMVQDDAYCIDVIKQIQAVQAALSKVSKLLLDDHMHTCVATAIQGNSPKQRQQMLAEVVSVFEISSRLSGHKTDYPNSYEGVLTMTRKTFTVPNISCGGCTNTIERKVGELAGVTGIKAERSTKQVTVTWEEPATWEEIQTVLQRINYPPEGLIQLN